MIGDVVFIFRCKYTLLSRREKVNTCSVDVERL